MKGIKNCLKTKKKRLKNETMQQQQKKGGFFFFKKRQQNQITSDHCDASKELGTNEKPGLYTHTSRGFGSRSHSFSDCSNTCILFLLFFPQALAPSVFLLELLWGNTIVSPSLSRHSL